MLNFLDGDNSLDNSFFIITTNHPEVIPKNILRPSRVDRFIKIDKLTDKDIERFLKFYLKREATSEEITSMKKQSLANLKDKLLNKRDSIVIKNKKTKKTMRKKIRNNQHMNKTKKQKGGYEQVEDIHNKMIEAYNSTQRPFDEIINTLLDNITKTNS